MEEKLNKYDFPIGRIGNTKNPVLIILLENQNSYPNSYKLNPEYTMRILGEFEPKNRENHEKHMKIETVVKYDKWWFELSKIWMDQELKISNDEVLALEYYPFATENTDKEKEIYNLKWEDNSYAKKSLEINKEILKNALNYNIPIFVYYKSGWYEGRDKYAIEPIIVRGQSQFISDYNPRGAVPSVIKNRLRDFLSESSIKKQICKLRENPNYYLKKK